MAAADGEIHDLERCLAAGVQRHILGTDDDFEASGPSNPASWPRESRRQRLRFDAVALSAMSATRRSLSRQVSTDGCALHRDGARASPTSWSGFKGLLDKQDGGAALAQAFSLAPVQRSLYAGLAVRRTDLEKRLKALGWAPTSKASGKNHRVWAHPRREHELYIPQYDLIPDAVGQRILEDAGD